MTTQIKRRLFTVADYHKMAEVGILSHDSRVELINGEIIQMSPIKSEHASCVDILTESLIKTISGRVIIRIQNPLYIDEHSEPEPDIAVVKFREDRYRKAHPLAQDTLLIIEVAESSLQLDRKVKARLYANAGVAQYWIVNLIDQTVECFSKPSKEGYLEKQTLDQSSNLTLTEWGWSLPVNQLFGK